MVNSVIAASVFFIIAIVSYCWLLQLRGLTKKQEIILMLSIENLGVSVEEYLDGLAAGIDILELKRLEAKGIPTNLALEVMAP